MKKAILIAATAISVLSCKKSELAESSQSTTADSVKTKLAISKSDSAAAIATTPEERKLLEKSKDSIPIIDSIATAAPVISAKKDSVAKTPTPQTVRVIVTPQKVIHEKKIIYRNAPKSTQKSPSAPKESKSAYLEFSTDNLQKALRDTREISANYNAEIFTEAQSSADEFQTASLEIRLPSTEFSNFITAMEFGDVGVLNSKNIRNTGADGTAKISLVLNAPLHTALTSPAGFGGKTLAAISSGGEAIGSVMLFLLPFWPLLLATAIGIYFYRRKKGKITQN